MIVQNWMTYVFMVLFIFLLQFIVAKVKGEKFVLMKALSLSGYACIGLTVYYLIMAW